jgi:hypothetical protein
MERDAIKSTASEPGLMGTGSESTHPKQGVLCIILIEWDRRQVATAKKNEYDVEKKRKGTRKQQRKNSAMVNDNRGGGNSFGAHLGVPSHP